MAQDEGASPSETGPSQAEPEVSALRASVPSAAACAEMLAVKVGYVFRLARLQQGKTEMEIAEKAEMSVVTLRRFERGDFLNAGLRKIGLIAWALDVEFEFRLTSRDSDTRPKDGDGTAPLASSAGPQDIAQDGVPAKETNNV